MSTEENASLKVAGESKVPALVKNQMQVGRNGLQLTTLDDMWRFATCVAKSGFAPKGIEKPESVLIALEMGFEVGLPPMSSLQNIAVVNGRPAVWGDAQAAVCFNSGLLEGGIEDEFTGTSLKDDWTCKVSVKRKGVEKPYTGEFSYGEARIAGLLTKDTWAKYPRKMLYARARSEALRKAFPDVLKGIKCAEEMEGVDEKPAVPASNLFGGNKPKIEDAEMELVDERPEEKPQAKSKKSKSDTTTQTCTALEELRLKLEAESLTDAQLMAYAERNGLLSSGGLSEDSARKILNAWQAVKEIIRGIK